MTKRDRVEAAYALKRVDRVPFVPAIYEHKARLVNLTPSDVCRNANVLEEALRKEVEIYDPDMLVVGVDVYNVEAEALGCRVQYFFDSNDVPAIVTRAIERPEDLDSLPLPDPQRDGRMPVFLAAAAALHHSHGGHMIVRGALTGPFSLAAELLGPERLLYALVDEPEFSSRLIDFCARVAVEYCSAFARRGVEPIVFDSHATPKVISPRLFRRFVVPAYRDIVVPGLKAAGARYIPLIIGGDTTPVLEDLLQTGATQLLCDFNADLATFRRRCLEEKRPLRANIDPRLLHHGTLGEIRSATRRLLDAAGPAPGFLLGSGVVPYDCDPSHIQVMREVIGNG